MTPNVTLAFYGDDFTGSTDVLESLSLNGVRTILFLEQPSPDNLESFEDVEAIGIAGRSRTMTPAEMDEELPTAFETLAEFDPELIHYKVCSTFDSSPEIGSIGHAIDIGQELFDAPFVPVVVAAPSLEPRGRYVLFGTLFATVEEQTYRIDRHPTMSQHPVTPMTEADLTRHLGEQTDREIGLLDIKDIDGKRPAESQAALKREMAKHEIVLFDGLIHEHQQRVGRLIWESCLETEDRPVFAAASSGLNYALTRHWKEIGLVSEGSSPALPDPVDQILVMSGSASPVNDTQIEWALENGFEGIRLDTTKLVDPDAASTERDRAIDAAVETLDSGSSPLLYTARGSDDPIIQETNRRLEELGIDRSRIGEILGTEQGTITRRVMQESNLSRLCIAGGDTSGHVTPKLSIYALEYAASVAPGNPLCDAISRNPEFDGIEIALKGGQVETTDDDPNIFGVVRDGTARHTSSH